MSKREMKIRMIIFIFCIALIIGFFVIKNIMKENNPTLEFYNSRGIDQYTEVVDFQEVGDIRFAVLKNEVSSEIVINVMLYNLKTKKEQNFMESYYQWDNKKYSFVYIEQENITHVYGVVRGQKKIEYQGKPVNTRYEEITGILKPGVYTIWKFETSNNEFYETIEKDLKFE